MMDIVGGQEWQKQQKAEDRLSKANNKDYAKIMLFVVPADASLQPQQFCLTCHLFLWPIPLTCRPMVSVARLA